MIGQKRPLKPKEVWAIGLRLQLEGQKRDLALFNLAIDSKLRGCDLVSLQVDDVCAAGRVRDRGTVIQKKTGRPVQFEITDHTRSSIRDWLSEVALGNSGPCTVKSAPRCPIRSRTWASRTRRILQGRCGSSPCLANAPLGGWHRIRILPHQRQSLPKPLASRSWCSRSLISAITQNKAISQTGSPRISRPICRGSRICS